MLQQPAGVVAGGEDQGLGPGGVLAQADRTAIATPPLLVNQADQQMPGRTGHFLQRSTDRLGDQFQPGQVTRRGNDVGGIGALRGAFAYGSGLLQAGERQIEETVGTAAMGEALAEVGRHAVVEAGIVRLHGRRVCEIEATADRFRGLSVRPSRAEPPVLNRTALRSHRAALSPEPLGVLGPGVAEHVLGHQRGLDLQECLRL